MSRTLTVDFLLVKFWFRLCVNINPAFPPPFPLNNFIKTSSSSDCFSLARRMPHRHKQLAARLLQPSAPRPLNIMAASTSPMSATRRRDGRSDNQIRPLAAEQGILNRADGSARFLQGNTSVLAAVYGPAPAKVARLEKADAATVDVNFKPESGITSPADSERELLLRRSLEEVVLRSRYPRCVVSVVIQVRRNGSSLFQVLVCVFRPSAQTTARIKVEHIIYTRTRGLHCFVQ